MNRFFGFLSVALPALAVTLLIAGPAQAQATRTWVSGVGDDANPCSRTAPCKTFPGAISKTAAGGEINCLDPGGFGTVTITKSITIDCHEIFGSILHSATNGINIVFDSFGADVRKTVRLRNLLLNGAGTTEGAIGINISGGTTIAGGTVIVEDCLLDGNFSGAVSGRGISDARTGGGKLIVTNTTVRDMGGGGISASPASGSTNIQVLLNDVRVYNAGTGAQFGAGTRVVIQNSAFTGNAGAGVLAQTGAIVNVNGSVMSHNANGVQTTAGGTIVLSNSDIAFNTSNGVSNAGTVQSFGNNRISNNAAAGAVPSLIGSTSNPTGQQ
jgi:hypothetical protein